MHTLSTLHTFTGDSRRFLASAFLWGFAFSVTWLYLNFLFESLGFSASLVGAANAIPNMVAIVLALPVVAACSAPQEFPADPIARHDWVEGDALDELILED